jgi:hypothetical protein
MNRWARRWWQLRKESRITPRLQEVLAEIASDLPELAGAKAMRSGHRGHDVTYLLSVGGQPKAVLRLNNSHTSRPLPLPDMPFRLDPPGVRILRERAAYLLGSQHGLTPVPIWHTADALLCRYEPCAPLMETLEADTGRAWILMEQASGAVDRLHRLGLTHMDMSFSNLLTDGTRLLVVDFEYTPIAGLTVASQRAYDHLRLLESIWKRIPEQRGGFAPWLDEVGQYLGTHRSEVQLNLLAPALSRLLGDPPLKTALEGLFPAAA